MLPLSFSKKIGLLINNTSFSKSHYLVNPEGILKYIDEHFLKINEEEIKKLKNKNILEIYNKSLTQRVGLSLLINIKWSRFLTKDSAKCIPSKL